MARRATEFTRILDDQDYTNAYATARECGAHDCTQDQQCPHLCAFLDHIKDIVLAEPGTPQWHAERGKRFTASPLSVLLESSSPFYGGRHLSHSREKLVAARAAALALDWFGTVASVPKKEQADNPRLAHGRAMEPLAVLVLSRLCQKAKLEMHGIAHVPCCRHPAVDCLAFTPDYAMCVRDPRRNSFRIIVVEVKSPYSRAFDPETPAPAYLYPQVVACATGLGIRDAALLQMWPERAVYTTVSPGEMQTVWREVSDALFRAEQQARDLALKMANHHLLLTEDSHPVQ